MRKYLIVLFLLQGCGPKESINHMAYVEVEAGCPTICSEKKEVWTGLVKLTPVASKCICKAPNSCLVTD